MVTIKFSDGTEIKAEQNGSCYITDTQFSIPDLSSIEIVKNDDKNSTIMNNCRFIFCTSIDSRFWFSFEEISSDEILRSDVDYLALMSDIELPSQEV